MPNSRIAGDAGKEKGVKHHLARADGSVSTLPTASMTSDNESKNMTVSLTGVQAEGQVGRVAAKGKTLSGVREGKKKRHEFESVVGDEFNSKGQMVKKERIIDRKNNLYSERVINEDTGEVVRLVNEPLSEHKGCGSAKHKNKKT
jgi:hypothetical protein